MRVAEAPAAALGDEQPLTGRRQIGDFFGRLRDRWIAHEDERADRNPNLEVVAGATRTKRAFTLPAALGGKLWCETEMNESVAVGIGDEIDGAALAAVTAIGAAARHELLAPEAECPAAAVAGLDVDVDFVDEHVVRAP